MRITILLVSFLASAVTLSAGARTRDDAKAASQRPNFPSFGRRQPAPGARPNLTQVAFDSLSSCIDPYFDQPGPSWEAELREHTALAQQQLDFDDEASHLQTVTRPLSLPGLLRDNLPHHHAMVVASNRFVSMPGASRGLRCHQFDYDAPPESLPDLHGCRLFHRSFRLLQRLRRCIAGELEASGRWQKHRKQAESGRMYEASAEVDVNSVDTFGRVDEVMKFVAVRDWKQIGSGIIDVVEKSIRKTISDVDLEASVVQKIRTKCLKVDRDDFNELSDESIVLKRALPCHAMMWDVFEVTGPPDQLLADAEHNFNPGYHTLATSMDLTRTPAICGRIATALIMRVVTHSPKGYKPVKCWLRNRHLTFEYCLHMQSHNCICAEKCWVAALEPACKLSPACCADAEKITSYTGFHVLNR
eukprot:TRINITY_DN5143_c0_g1_i1.p2 TRINITY_DN5143_c0_g1~~TRINITY_DN5143_c0_g1_i1.p2  ORF type:complete len:417 (-),score=80.64 TRINITY_DN5143_c0_g1_i1:140-1390(-)